MQHLYKIIYKSAYLYDSGVFLSKRSLVIKFGGAALALSHHFFHAAALITKYMKTYDHIVVVVSAMGETTDHLIRLAQTIHDQPPCREMDMLISVGERVSMSLLQ